MSSFPRAAVVTSSEHPSSGSSLPEWVARQYYRHGLFCSSHPRTVLLLAVACALWTCWPLFTLPIYGGEIKVFSERVRGIILLSIVQERMTHNSHLIGIQ